MSFFADVADRERGEERIAIGGADRLLADRSAPCPRRPTSPATRRGSWCRRRRRDSLRGICAGLAIGLDDVVGAAGDAFEQRAIDVAAVVGEVEAEEHALGLRIVDRRPLAGEIGQHDQPLGAGRRGLRFRGETLRWRSPDRARGPNCRGTSGSACRWSRAPPSTRAGPGRARARTRGADRATRPFDQHDDEDGRAVHHHHVARHRARRRSALRRRRRSCRR